MRKGLIFGALNYGGWYCVLHCSVFPNTKSKSNLPCCHGYRYPIGRDTGFQFTIMVFSKKLKFTRIRVELLLEYPTNFINFTYPKYFTFNILE